MAEFKVVAGDDTNVFRVEGLKNPVLKSLDATFVTDFTSTDTQEDMSDKMRVALWQDVRGSYRNVKDGDVFDTPHGKFIVRGNLVVTYDDAQVQASIAQVNPPTGPQTVGQMTSHMGIPSGSLPTGLGNLPIPGAGNVQSPGAQAPSLAGLASPFAMINKTLSIVDNLGNGLSSPVQLSGQFTNGEVVDVFEQLTNGTYADGDLRNSIVFPNGRRVLEVHYANGTSKIFIDVQ